MFVDPFVEYMFNFLRMWSTITLTKLEYMGVIRFGFSCPPTSTDYIWHNIICIAFANLWWSISTYTCNEPQTFSWFSHDYWICMFVDLFTVYIYRSYQLCSLFECTIVSYETWKCSPIFLKQCLLWCLFFDPHLNTHQSNIGVQLGIITE